MPVLSVGPRAKNLARTAHAAILGAPSRERFDDIRAFLGGCNIKTIWMVGTSHDADMARALGSTCDVEVKLVDAREDPSGVVGDLFGAFVGSEGTVVAFDVDGNNDVRRAIRVASGYAGVPLLARRETGGIFVDSPREVTPSLVLGALRFTLTAQRDNGFASDFDLEVRERGFHTLVKRVRVDGANEFYGMTGLLQALLIDDQLARSSDYSSACADLLEQRGHVEIARRFRVLIRHWVEQRLWDANFVPEMVLHNAAHAAAVDRNVASLWEPLRQSKKLDELDLVVLAAAAWLHDWGHASANASGRLPTNPIDVRYYHGLFTAIRLEDLAEKSRHGLKALVELGLCNEVYGKDWLAFARDVALLCAHHQGWTSSDRSPREPRPIEDMDKLYIWIAESDKGFRLRSFEGSYSYCVRNRLDYFAKRGDLSARLLNSAAPLKKDAEDDLDPRTLDWNRAQLRLAILRVADAADVGVHRVPDYYTQHAHRDSIADEYLGRQADLTKKALRGWSSPPDAYVNPMEDVKVHFREVRTELKQMAIEGASITEKEVEALFDQRVDSADVLNGGSVPDAKPELEFVLNIARSAFRYTKHLAAQRAYYDDHEAVRAAIPVLSTSDDGSLELVVHVLPTDRKDGARRAIRIARNIIAREWGWVVGASKGAEDNETPGDDADLFKSQIGNYLAEAGIVNLHVRGAEIVVSEVKYGSPDVPLVDVAAAMSGQLRVVGALPLLAGGWVVGAPDGILVRQPDPAGGTRSIGSSPKGDRVAVVKSGARLQLWNPDGVGLVAEHQVVGLEDGLAALAVGEGASVLLATSEGAIEYDLETRRRRTEITCAGGAKFVRAFGTPHGWILVDDKGVLHGQPAGFGPAQVSGIDLLLRDADVWVVASSPADRALTVTRWTSTGMLNVPPVPLEGGFMPAEFGWARASEPGPDLVLVVVDPQGVSQRFRVLADGSGWAD